jgi:hypothetical protein
VSAASFSGEVFSAARSIDNGRTSLDAFTHCLTEIGELAEEVIIRSGRSYKESGPDGIIGEVIDVMICLIDIEYLMHPDRKDRDVDAIIEGFLKDNRKSFTPQECLARLACMTGELGYHLANGRVRLDPMDSIEPLCKLIKVFSPDITIDEIVDIGRPKIQKWIDHAYEGVT